MKLLPHIPTITLTWAGVWLYLRWIHNKTDKEKEEKLQDQDNLIRDIQTKVFNIKVTFNKTEITPPTWFPWLCKSRRETSKTNKKSNMGTGFLIYRDILVTNQHVIENGNKKNAKLKVYDSTFHQYEGEVLRSYSKKDIAFVKIKNFIGDKPLKMSPQKIHYIRDPIMAVTIDQGDKVHHVTFGNITEYYQENRLWWIQSSILVAPGFSGSPLLNMNGEVIGVNTSSHDDHNTLSQAVAISQVIELYEKDIVPLLKDE